MRSTFTPNRIFDRQSSQNRHTGVKFSSKRENSALSMKIVQNGIFRSCAARFGQIVFLKRQSCQNRHTGLKFSLKRENSALSMKIVQNGFFLVMRSTFWPNRSFDRQRSHNRHNGLTFSPKRENSALFIKIVQNALFRSCAARFGQILFLSIKVLKIVKLTTYPLENGETVRFS